VCNGQITELANDWDGFSGTIPKSAATVAEVLKDYGYNTAAFGKWHNTPAIETTTKGPFEYWPTGYGFEYFYGFLAGETSQWEPNLVRNTTYVNHPKTSGGHNYYHLTEDLADDAIKWLREQQAFAPDKPFFIYWATGAAHGPHHIMKEWADKYKGKFNDGWDKYREGVFENQKKMGWIPQDAQLTSRPETLPSWVSIPDDQKPFQQRLMEIWAGFTEHADYNAGRILDELKAEGRLDNTIVIYILGDNGNSAEGQNGTISELLAQNSIPTTIDQHIKALNELGGLDVLGSDKTDNHYNAAWAWAGSSPYRSTKLVAAHFGGTRQPMAISWPAKIKHDAIPRSQFHHFIDLVPTIYDVLGITPPAVVNGVEQMPIDGISMAYAFNDAKAKGQRTTQFFDILGSRGIYNNGWYACTFGPRTPWIPGMPKGIHEWNPENDKWELYNLDNDWTQANDLAAKMPLKLEEMKSLFLVESAKNKNLPIGGGLWTVVLHPEYLIRPPYTSWIFQGTLNRMPEFNAPKVGTMDNTIQIQTEIPSKANGVLYALGGFSGGLTCYVKDGHLCYEYNLFEISRTKFQSKEKLPTGSAMIEVISDNNPGQEGFKPGAPMNVSFKVNGKDFGQVTIPISIPLTFTANDSFDIGSDESSPVSEAYFARAPFAFNGKIITTKVWYNK
jgi:arylsulfatase